MRRLKYFPFCVVIFWASIFEIIRSEILGEKTSRRKFIREKSINVPTFSSSAEFQIDSPSIVIAKPDEATDSPMSLALEMAMPREFSPAVTVIPMHERSRDMGMIDVTRGFIPMPFEEERLLQETNDVVKWIQLDLTLFENVFIVVFFFERSEHSRALSRAGSFNKNSSFASFMTDEWSEISIKTVFLSVRYW